MSILIWILIGFLVYFCCCCACFHGAVLRQAKKTKDGRLCIKRGWVIRFFYGVNISREIQDKDFRFPKNTCQLYKGIYLGIPFLLFSPFLFLV